MCPVIRGFHLRPTSISCALLAFVAFVAVAAGCGGRPDGRDAGRSATGATGTAARTPGATPDTSRDGAAFVAIYPSGPYEEIRVVRTTDGALVAGGSTRFPDGTAITVTLMGGDAARPEPIATSRATVELGRFMSGPLAPWEAKLPPGVHTLRFTVAFGAADQAPGVLRAADDGRRFEGPGSSRGPDGRIIHEITLEAPL
jgi:hypothetical protein